MLRRTPRSIAIGEMGCLHNQQPLFGAIQAESSQIWERRILNYTVCLHRNKADATKPNLYWEQIIEVEGCRQYSPQCFHLYAWDPID